ncbi:MAG TPA: hypothetical protein VK619_03830 [Pyrinomonadaceae bacterium]|nr:hypothetical protein [Pyrinomonadaceae bacterium]
METTHFINPGYGWLCKHCSVRDDVHLDRSNRRARFFNEGEAEEKEPKLSTLALAKWRDPAHRTLVCPRCGIEEVVNKA